MMPTRLNTPSLLCIALWLACALCVTASAQTASQSGLTKIRFGDVTGNAYPTLIVAQQRGYFEKAGLVIERFPLAGSGLVTEALASGNIDLGNTTLMSSMLATAKGGKTRLVSGLESTFTDKSGRQWEATYVVVRSEDGIKSLDDLRGKRIAVNDIGSVYNYMIRAYYLARGINPDRDVTIVAIPFAQMAGAFVQKQVDAMIATADGYAQARQRAKVNVIATHSTLEGLDVALTSAIGVNDGFLAANPDVVVRFLRALLQARLWMNEAVANNDPELLSMVAKYMKYTPERAQLVWETRAGYYGKEMGFVNLLDITGRQFERDSAILKAVGLLKPDRPITYDAIVDLRPLRKAYDSLGLAWDQAKH